MKAAHNDSRSKMSVVIPKYCTGDFMHIRYSANGKKRMAADLALKMTLPIGFAIVGIGYAIYILGNPNSTSFDMALNGLLFILVCGVSFCGCRAMLLIWCMKYVIYTFTDKGLIVVMR